VNPYLRNSLIGALVGAVPGGLYGASTARKDESTWKPALIGAGLGAGAGALAGYGATPLISTLESKWSRSTPSRSAIPNTRNPEVVHNSVEYIPPSTPTGSTSSRSEAKKKWEQNKETILADLSRVSSPEEVRNFERAMNNSFNTWRNTQRLMGKKSSAWLPEYHDE
jgi:hypothetical protein